MKMTMNIFNVSTIMLVAQMAGFPVHVCAF
jgi:hypothetical protein